MPIDPRDRLTQRPTAKAVTESGQSQVRRRAPQAVDPDAPPQPANYRLLRPLGATAYGRAFLAEHALGRTVALHFLPRDASAERTLSRDLPLVVAKCAQLAHPNVIALEDYGAVGVEGQDVYLVTEPLDGTSLREYLEAQGPLPVQHALGLARQIGRALRAAHQLGVLHGDLRPENVRVSSTEQGPLVKVLGFGSAALRQPVLGRGGAETQRSAYTAPELARGHSVDPRGDVYALGAITFRMIAGSEPRDEALAPGAARPASLRALVGEHVPREVDALVRRCLERVPEDRFVDTVALMQAMRSILNEESGALTPEALEPQSLPHRDTFSILPRVRSEPSDSEHGLGKEIARERWLWLLLAVLLALGLLREVWTD